MIFRFPANLTVSGQLEGELGALALGAFIPLARPLGQKIQIHSVIFPNFG